MTRNLLISLILPISIIANAQQLYKSLNGLRANDVLERVQVVEGDFGLQSVNGVWSLEDLKFSERSYKTGYSLETDTLAEKGHSGRTYLRQELDEVVIIGQESPLTLLSYDMPETWMRYPMEKGDSLSGYFHSSGPYCERMFLRHFGSYLTKMDDVGKMVLPSNDTLRDVTRLHTERYFCDLALPIDTMQYKIPQFTTDSIVRRMRECPTLLREDIYRWYALGYRYPVVEARVLSVEGQELEREVYYYAPESQQMLADDEANKEVRARADSEAIEGDDGRYHSDQLPGDAFDFSYQVVQPEGSDRLNVNVSLNHTARIKVILASTLGYVYKSAEMTGEIGANTLNIDCIGLHRGQYIVYVSVDGKGVAEKIGLK